MTDIDRINEILVTAWSRGEESLTPAERARLDEAWRRECRDAEETARSVEEWR